MKKTELLEIPIDVCAEVWAAMRDQWPGRVESMLSWSKERADRFNEILNQKYGKEYKIHSATISEDHKSHIRPIVLKVTKLL